MQFYSGLESNTLKVVRLDFGLVWSLNVGTTASARLQLETIKRLKGIWGMPWRMQAMKDVARCDKRRGVASRL